ncbi:hypothetical protein AKJ57_02655 [candidate division MSBL1 archaeon SCGC-AAA259A05]|uniref:CARDB domain-containing protein n=1 Tax=candidate division MSBL1 archaeon SCGC-AAA259A05 TaxID=1698259 RepID=A0A133UA12_9EURY|nr:hypothetical protein AKJ57_02655 [candidate division MSBL1 archaeon SCGC-AAA259A05]
MSGVSQRSAEFVSRNIHATPAEAKPGETVTISVDVKNIGGEKGSKTLELSVGGETKTRKVTLEAGENTSVNFSLSKDKVGSYSVSVDGLTESFEVTPRGPAVRVSGADYDEGAIKVTIESTLKIRETDVRIKDKNGNLLAEKEVTLEKGTNTVVVGPASAENVTVTVQPPVGEKAEKNFALELPPLLRFEPGKAYLYRADGRKVHIYLEEETEEFWKGIAFAEREGTGGKEALLMKFKVNKDNLSVLSTYPLTKQEVRSDSVEYRPLQALKQVSGNIKSVYFPLLLPTLRSTGYSDLNPKKLISEGSIIAGGDYGKTEFSVTERRVYDGYLSYAVQIKPPNQGENITFHMATARPYMTIDLDIPEEMYLSIKNVQNKSFNLEEYGDYSIPGYSPPPKANIETNVALDNENKKINVTLTHLGGDVLKGGDIQIEVYPPPGHPVKNTLKGLAGIINFRPGEEKIISVKPEEVSLSQIEAVVVVLTHIPSGTRISEYEKEIKE